MRARFSIWFTALCLLMWSVGVQAIVINLSYVPSGQRFGNSATQIATDAPGSRPGGGNLHDIMRAAADVWERVLPEPFSIDIEYGWRPLTGNTVGLHYGRGVDLSGGVTRNRASWIAFNAGFNGWYFDPQPTDSSEYARLNQGDGTYGGVRVNDELRYTQPRTNDARGLDLFTVALHEIGHSVGWTFGNLADFQRDRGAEFEDEFRIAAGLPGAGALVEVHGTHPENADTLLMAHLLSTGQRVLPSVLDIASVATISRYNSIRTGLDAIRGDTAGYNAVDVTISGGSTVRLNLGRVFDLPEPGSAGVFAVFVASMMLRRRTPANVR